MGSWQKQVGVEIEEEQKGIEIFSSHFRQQQEEPASVFVLFIYPVLIQRLVFFSMGEQNNFYLLVLV